MADVALGLKTLGEELIALRMKCLPVPTIVRPGKRREGLPQRVAATAERVAAARIENSVAAYYSNDSRFATSAIVSKPPQLEM